MTENECPECGYYPSEEEGCDACNPDNNKDEIMNDRMTESPIGAVFRGETNPTTTKEKQVTEPKEPKRKVTPRVSLRDFPDAVIAFLMMDDSGPRLAPELAEAMKKFDKRFAKASMSGMENRIRDMAKEGKLTMVVGPHDRFQRFKVPVQPTPVNSDPGPEPLVLEPRPRPLMTPKIFADHVEISISDWVILMQGLEATEPGES